MIDSSKVCNASRPNTVINPSHAGCEPLADVVAEKMDIIAIKPMFSSATVLKTLNIFLNEMYVKSQKKIEEKNTKREDGASLMSSRPCRQLLTKLRNIHCNIDNLKSKGVLMGENADIVNIGYEQIPQGIDIDFKSR